jgi:hypothetical protein
MVYYSKQEPLCREAGLCTKMDPAEQGEVSTPKHRQAALTVF